MQTFKKETVIKAFESNWKNLLAKKTEDYDRLVIGCQAVLDFLEGAREGLVS